MSSTDGSTHYAALPTIRFVSNLVLGEIVFGHKQTGLGKKYAVPTLWNTYPYSFAILYNDQQMHNYFTNYHTATCFDTIVSSSDSL